MCELGCSSIRAPRSADRGPEESALAADDAAQLARWSSGPLLTRGRGARRAGGGRRSALLDDPSGRRRLAAAQHVRGAARPRARRAAARRGAFELLGERPEHGPGARGLRWAAGGDEAAHRIGGADPGDWADRGEAVSALHSWRAGGASATAPAGTRARWRSARAPRSSSRSRLRRARHRRRAPGLAAAGPKRGASRRGDARGVAPTTRATRAAGCSICGADLRRCARPARRRGPPSRRLSGRRGQRRRRAIAGGAPCGPPMNSAPLRAAWVEFDHRPPDASHRLMLAGRRRRPRPAAGGRRASSCREPVGSARRRAAQAPADAPLTPRWRAARCAAPRSGGAAALGGLRRP